MITRFNTEVVIVSCVLLTLCKGSTISIVSDKRAIQPYLTPSLSLQCFFEDSKPSSDGALVGRSLTQNEPAIQYVTSVIVMRNGADIARISQFSPAEGLADFTNLKVTASTNYRKVSLGLGIDLQWRYPTPEQIGSYTCEINALDDSGRNVVLTNSLEIKLNKTSFIDLSKHINGLKVENSVQQANLTDLTNQIKAQEAKNTNLEDMIAGIQAQMSQMASSLAQTKHFEHGAIYCGDSSSWTEHKGNRVHINHNATFTNRYNTPPYVYLSVTFEQYATDARIDYYVRVVNVDKDSFVMTCHTAPENPIAAMRVDWISIPQ